MTTIASENNLRLVLLFGIFSCAICVLAFLAAGALFRLRDLGFPIWPVIREALFVGLFVGLLTPPLTPRRALFAF